MADLTYRNWQVLLAAVEKQPVGLGSPQLIELLRQMLEQSRVQAVAIGAVPGPEFDVNGVAVKQPPNLVDAGGLMFSVAGKVISPALPQPLLTVGAVPLLTSSRALTAGTGIQTTDNGGGSTFVIQTVPGWVFIENKVAYAAGTGVGGGSWTTKTFGDEFASFGAALSGVAGSATEPFLIHCLASNFNAETGLAGNGQWYLGLDFDFYCRLRLNTTTLQRLWCGMSDVGEATIFATDTMSNHNVAAFRFSTSATDANYQSVVNNGGAGTQVVKDTGIAPDLTNTVLFHISFRKSTGFVTFYINEVQVTQHTTVVPAAGTALLFIVGIRSLDPASATLHSFDLGWVFEQQRRPIP